MNLLLLIVPTLVTSLKGTNFLLPFTETEKRNHLILDCLPAGPTVRRKVSLSISLDLSLCIWISLSISGCLCLYLSASYTLRVSLPSFPCLYMSVFVSLCQSMYVSVSFPLLKAYLAYWTETKWAPFTVSVSTFSSYVINPVIVVDSFHIPPPNRQATFIFLLYHWWTHWRNSWVRRPSVRPYLPSCHSVYMSVCPISLADICLFLRLHYIPDI